MNDTLVIIGVHMMYLVCGVLLFYMSKKMNKKIEEERIMKEKLSELYKSHYEYYNN